MKLHEKSHVGVTPDVLVWVLDRFKGAGGFVKETVELPEGLTAESGLYGPAAGDDPVAEGDVFYEKRGDRANRSRMVRMPKRATRLVTVIAGPYEGEPCVLYTAHGGPCAPKEPGDVTIKSEGERKESEEFWADHALAAG